MYAYWQWSFFNMFMVLMCIFFGSMLNCDGDSCKLTSLSRLVGFFPLLEGVLKIICLCFVYKVLCLPFRKGLVQSQWNWPGMHLWEEVKAIKKPRWGTWHWYHLQINKREKGIHMQPALPTTPKPFPEAPSLYCAVLGEVWSQHTRVNTL